MLTDAEEEKLKEVIRVVLRGLRKTFVHDWVHVPPEHPECPLCVATITLRNYVMERKYAD